MMKNNFVVRKAEPKDAQGIHDAHMRSILEVCAKDYNEEQLNVWGRRPFSETIRVQAVQNDHVWVLDSDEGIKGYAHLHILRRNAKSSGHLHALYLVPEALNKGFGKVIINKVIDLCRDLSLDRIGLYSTLTSFEFYKKCGFRKLPAPEFLMMGDVKIPSYAMELWLKNSPPHIQLVKPSVVYKDSFLDAWDEMKTESDKSSWIYGRFDSFDPKNDFSSYVNELNRRCLEPPANHVTGDVYWAVLENEVVGRIALRHDLNEDLKNVGGHVGYIVRPSYRGRGIASEMLRQILMTETARNISKLLLTCDPDNLASQRTIEKNGGIFTSSYESGQIKKTHYWINMVAIPDIETERLLLQRLYQKDAQDVFDYASDPEVAKTVTWDAHKFLEDSLAFIAHQNLNFLARTEDKQFLVWGIRLKDTGKVIGTISFNQYRDQLGQIDYAIGQAYWSKGYASEAAKVVRDWAFKNAPKLERIQSTCLVDNKASQRVMEKMGMTFEQIKPKGIQIKGKAVDLAVYAILRGI